jgi:hypothetical protein
VEAFAFFGGVPRRLVPDNLRTGVDKPDLYDPKINRSYAELAEHYGVLVDPARVRKPRDKAQVERPMPYVRDSFWRGREFTSLADARRRPGLVHRRRRARACVDWRAAGRGTDTVERDALARCRPRRSCWTTSRARGSPDIHATVAGRLLSRGGTSGPVDVRSTESMVQLFHPALVKAMPQDREADRPG